MTRNRINSIAWGAAVAVSLALATVSCKQKKDPGSQAQSLDNFVKSSKEAQTVNRCGHEYNGGPLPSALESRVAAISAPTEALKNATIGVLLGVPENLMSPFFAAGGKIVITDQAPVLCAGTLSDAERNFAGTAAQKLRACWRQPGEGATPEIIVAASEEDVHHGLLRVFAYVFADLFVHRAGLSDAPEANTPTWREAVEGFKASRNGLATTFLAELATPETQATYARLESFREAAGDKFASFVAAEAVDSFYCSPKTREVFWQQFPKTYMAFIDEADEHALARQFGPPSTAP